MITTVTLNAAIDKTYYMDDFLLGKVNRMRKMHAVPGGKGLNVAKVVQALGAPVVTTGFVGGMNGEFILQELGKQHIAHDFVRTESGESRLCLNMISIAAGSSTEILEPGINVSVDDVQLLKDKVAELARKSRIVAFSGSIPQGTPTDVYAQLIQITKSCGALAFLDTSGPPLLKGAEAAPFFLKPNEDEVKVLLQRDEFSETDLVNGVREFMQQGIKCVVATLGETGSIAGYEGACYRVRAPKVQALNPVGCGDSFVAGMAVGFLRGLPFEQTIRQATAAATANALSEQAGQVDMEDVNRLLTEVEIELI